MITLLGCYYSHRQDKDGETKLTLAIPMTDGYSDQRGKVAEIGKMTEKVVRITIEVV